VEVGGWVWEEEARNYRDPYIEEIKIKDEEEKYQCRK
jgi:hypothetical protein